MALAMEIQESKHLNMDDDYPSLSQVFTKLAEVSELLLIVVWL